MAVALQTSARVVIVKRDVATGMFEEFVADIQIGEYTGAASVDGQITSVVWDETVGVEMK